MIEKKKEFNEAKRVNRIAQDGVDLARTKLEVQEDIGERVQGQADAAKKLGDNINSFFSSLPGGQFLTKALGMDTLGDDLEKGVIDNLLWHSHTRISTTRITLA